MLNPKNQGTKVAAQYRLTIDPGQCHVLRLRLCSAKPDSFAATGAASSGPFGSQFEDVFEARRSEADTFYASVIPASLDADAARVMRQALAGMLWTKQFYYYDVDRWLEERGCDPFKPTPRFPRGTTSGITCITGK